MLIECVKSKCGDHCMMWCIIIIIYALNVLVGTGGLQMCHLIDVRHTGFQIENVDWRRPRERPGLR
jgi:hypothetical protein